MYIRRTTIKSRRSGEPYYTYRLVESVRLNARVRQRTLLNLGRHFAVPREHWGPLTQRIEALLHGQLDLMPGELDPQWDGVAQEYAARILRDRGAMASPTAASRADEPDYQRVDLASLELMRPRSVGLEQVALGALQQLGLDRKLDALGFNGQEVPAAIGSIVGRMVQPGSELSTHEWLQQRSGLGELLGHDFNTTKLNRLYRVSDRLLHHRSALEAHLYGQERELFALAETITLYDLTNTFFEGAARGNPKAQRGHSKEKRSDCPLVTLGLVLDASGFPRRSEVFAGNVSEPKTLEQMLQRLSASAGAGGATVVLDAGIATEENVEWLKARGYRYLVVSRSRHRQFDEQQATLIKDDGKVRIQIQRVVDEAAGEVRLYCHSSRREEKDRAIQKRFSARLEEALQHLAEGLHKKRCVKQYDKVLTRIGRLRQRYSSVARYYDIRIDKDEDTGNATALHWSRNTTTDQTHPGVYCLRTNQEQWDEQTLWRTYTMLTDLEGVFRALKSELGLRPVYHQKEDRVSGHLFISVLAYHLVHTIRFQLKAHDIHLSWESLRRQLDGQDRVTAVIRREDGKIYHIRKATRPEPRQQVIIDALGLSRNPGGTEKTLVDPARVGSADKCSA
jgi:transposase